MLSIIIYLSLVLFVTAQVNTSNIFFVDSFGKNILYRTGNPTNSTTLDYDTLVSTFKTLAQQQGLIFPDSFKLITICLLNQETNSEIVQKEINFYRNNSSLGYLIQWPVGAENYSDPRTWFANVRTVISLDYPVWSLNQLQQLAVLIRNLISQQDDQAKIVYFHCMSGINLVSEAFGSYMIMQHDWTFAQVLQWKNLTQPQPSSVVALDWFCWYWQNLARGGNFYQCNYTSPSQDSYISEDLYNDNFWLQAMAVDNIEN